MLQKLTHAVAIVVLLTGAASAQSFNVLQAPTDNRTPEDRAREKVLEGEYRSAVSKIPDKKPASDPWGTVRSTPDTAASKQKRQ